METNQTGQAVVAIPRTSWRPAAVLSVVVLHFSLFGCLTGVKGVLWVEFLTALQIGEGRFGTAQFVSPLVSTLVLLRYAPLAAWLGPKALTIIGLALATVALIVLAWSTSVWSFLASLALLGAGTSTLDGAMNQAAIDWEAVTERRLMNFIHACFSGGAVLGALAAGAGLNGGWRYTQVLIVLAIVFAITALLTLAVRYPPRTTTTDATPSAWSPIVRTPALRALMLIIGLSIVVESIVFLWSVIYVRTELHAPVVLGSVAFAMFNSAMFAGRLMNGPIVAARGVRASLLISGLGLILGTVVLMTTRNVALAIGALVVLGVAIAGIFPTVVAAASAVLPGASASLTGALMTITYVCFMLAPPVVGWVAEWSSLRLALALVGLCGLGIVGSAWTLDRKPAPAYYS